MSRKKILFVIVEGPSDENALGAIFSRIFDSNFVYVHVVHGDITTKNGVNSSNVLSKIGEVVKKYAGSNHYKQADFYKIIHITDTDGAFVSETCVRSFDKPKTKYTSDAIYTRNPEDIIRRNSQKSILISKLYNTSAIWEIPYRMFYMSCNLDHVLFNKQNSNDEEKERDAYDFAIRYKDDPDEFLSFVSNSDFSVNRGYIESWEFIKDNCNSLCRYTNLVSNLFLDFTE